MLDAIFERFVKLSPVSVMVRGLMERVLNTEQLDSIFENHATRQYRRELLFSSIVYLMSLVSCYAAKPDKIALPLFLIFRSHLITISPSFNNLCSNSDNSSTDLNSRCAIYSFAECQTNSIKL